MATEVATVQSVADPKPPLRAGGGIGAIVPQDAEQAYRMAQLIVKSGLAPKDMSTPEKVVTAIFHGLEVGLKPMQAVQSIAVVNGRPCIWGDAALGLVMGSGALADISETIEGDGDDMTAICRATRAGMSSAVERRFSVADAKKAGLWGKTGPWTNYSRRMLQMRARSWALRDGFADVLKGLHVYEEVRDFAMAATVADNQAASSDIRAALTKRDDPAPPIETTGGAGATASGDQGGVPSPTAAPDEGAPPASNDTGTTAGQGDLLEEDGAATAITADDAKASANSAIARIDKVASLTKLDEVIDELRGIVGQMEAAGFKPEADRIRKAYRARRAALDGE